MTYSIDRAELIAAQLERFAHQHVHQLVGHLANREFWLGEAAEALRALDEYPRRFRALRDAQMAWVDEHQVTIGFCRLCRGACELGPRSPDPPRRTSSDDLEAARQQVRRAAYRFLLRCHRAGVLPEADLAAACARVGVTLEPEDLEG